MLRLVLRSVALATLMLAALLGAMLTHSTYGSALSTLHAARAVEVVHTKAAGALITVTTTQDEVNEAGDCSLREALEAAATNTAIDSCPAGSGDDTVYIPAGSYQLDRGQLQLTGTVTLQGSLTATTILQGNDYYQYRVVYILPGASVSLRRLHITKGGGGGEHGEYPFDGSGGGVANYGTASIVDSVIYNNHSGGSGVQYSGHGSDGGGIYNQGVLTVSNSTISGNKASDGISEGNCHAGICWCSSGGDGGGIANNGDLQLDNVTMTQNKGGVETGPEDSCQIAGETSTIFGGLFNGPAGSVSIQNSIIADNEGSDCGGDPLTSLGNNLLRTLTNCTINGDYLHWTAHLGHLQDNGGATLTHAPEPRSAAIDAGSCTDSLGITVTVDQRGVARPLGDSCDIGAYESPYTSTFAISTTNLIQILYQ